MKAKAEQKIAPRTTIQEREIMIRSSLEDHAFTYIKEIYARLIQTREIMGLILCRYPEGVDPDREKIFTLDIIETEECLSIHLIFPTLKEVVITEIDENSDTFIVDVYERGSLRDWASDEERVRNNLVTSDLLVGMKILVSSKEVKVVKEDINWFVDDIIIDALKFDPENAPEKIRATLGKKDGGAIIRPVKELTDRLKQDQVVDLKDDLTIYYGVVKRYRIMSVGSLNSVNIVTIYFSENDKTNAVRIKESSINRIRNLTRGREILVSSVGGVMFLEKRPKK